MRLDLGEVDLHQLAGFVRDNSPYLAALWLEPDGTFQTRAMSHASLAREVVAQLREGFRELDPAEFPHLYYGCGIARVGSTSLANVLGLAGIPSYYQPVKTILRCVLHGAEPVVWRFEASQRQIFAKETFGPYTAAECIFLPVELLLDAGYPCDRLHVIMLDREPASVLASWFDKWAHRVPETTLFGHYLIATLNAQRVARRAIRRGVRVTTYVYELSRNPRLFVPALFERLGISDRYRNGVIAGWEDKGDLASEQSGVVFLQEPQIFEVPGLHGSDVAYRYHDRAPMRFPPHIAALLAESGIDDLYRNSVQACIADFAIDHLTARQTFGDAFALKPSEIS
jgi:hypothetical protein